MDQPDVVVVGAGIAGGAMATVLARAGLDVVIVERDAVYRDRVRGETMFPWGVAELERLGLKDVLLAAGGGFAREVYEYDELYDPAMSRPIPLHAMVADVEGSLNVGHPESCRALASAAEHAGSRVHRGVADVVVSSGPEPVITWVADGASVEVRPRLVIGADGRRSGVRRDSGIGWHETDATLMLAGLLVSGWDGWPPDVNVNGMEGDYFFLAFPRPGGLARLYLEWRACGDRRMTGPGRVEDFLEVFRTLTCVPGGDRFGNIRPAGPLASYPMTDGWTEDPTADGVVLVGDAAGWSDPTIGQGLSIAMRDVRIVSELLLANRRWDRELLGPYVDERRERMRRLRITSGVMLTVFCDASERGRERRRAWRQRLIREPALLRPVAVMLTGPESAPAEYMTEAAIDLVRGLGAEPNEPADRRSDAT